MLNAFFQIPTYILFVIIFCLIIFANWSGYRYKKWQIKKTPGQVRESMGYTVKSLNRQSNLKNTAL